MRVIPSPPGWARALDVHAYAVRQAQSCWYLGAHFIYVIRACLRDADRDLMDSARAVFMKLSTVHGRQFYTLKHVVPFPGVRLDKRSFYFESLLREVAGVPHGRLDWAKEAPLDPVMAVQWVSYLRGEDRYNAMVAEGCAFEDVWRDFLGDAASNADLVSAFLDERGVPEELRQHVVDTEANVMRSIWKHNGLISGEPEEESCTTT
jgi:hypothetical protein